MDKTFNDLMDIVNRTKKIDGKETPRPRPRPQPKVEEEEVVEEYTPREYDIEEKKTRKTRSSISENSAIGKMLGKKTSKKSTKTSSSSKTTKKAPAKTTKKTTSKKETDEDKVEAKKAPVKKTSTTKPQSTISAPNYGDPKNAQLYEALQNSLLKGGTDISEYMTDNGLDEAQSNLQEIRAKREAQKINAEISKEQQEYEQLFNGSFASFMGTEEETEEEIEETNDEEKIDVAKKNAELANDLSKIKADIESKKHPTSINSVARDEKNAHDSTFELETGNKDLDRKIAEYYRRKQEKINEYKAQEENYEEVKTTTNDENAPVDYEAIFGGTMTTRAELMGEPVEETSVEETPSEENANTTVSSEIDSNNSIENKNIESKPIEENENIENQENVDSTSVEENTPAPETEDNSEIESTENVDSSDTTEENTEIDENTEVQQDKKDENIKNILSDLLFSKKAHEEEKLNDEAKDNNLDTEVENNDENQTLEESSTRDHEEYAKVWGGTLSEETNNDDSSQTEEVINEEVVNEETINNESVNNESTETKVVEGESFVMTDAPEEPKEVTEYIDRTPAVVEDESTDNTSENEIVITENEEPKNEIETPVENNIEQTEKKEETPTSYTTIDFSDEDDDFVLKFNNNPTSAESPSPEVEENQIEETQDVTTENEIAQVTETQDASTQNKVEQVEKSQDVTAQDEVEPVEESQDIITQDEIEPVAETSIVESQENDDYSEPTQDETEETLLSEDETETLVNSNVSNEEVEPFIETQETESTLAENSSETNDNVISNEDEEKTSESSDDLENYIIPTNEENSNEIEDETTQVYDSLESTEGIVIDNENTIENETIKDVYNLNNEDTNLDDYIVSSNIPTENATTESNITITDDIDEENIDIDSSIESEEVINETSEEESNEIPEPQNTDPIITETELDNIPEETINETVNQNPVYSNSTSYINNDEEDNTFVMNTNTLPENKFDVFGNEIANESNSTNNTESNNSNTISRNEFYNEMARLQENIVNELKGKKVETESKDFFAEEKEVSVNDQDFVNSIADQIIEKLTEEGVEDETPAEPTTPEEVVPEKTEEEIREETLYSADVGTKAEPVDPELFDAYNLLGKDVALNEDDLEYQEKVNSEDEEVKEVKDNYFYGSKEDNEKKASVVDEFMNLFNDEPHQAKEVGDINFFKNIGNATPSSAILETKEYVEPSNEEIETIYTFMGLETKPAPKPENDIKVLYVASECQPFIASGGLGDVAGSLPKAIAEAGGVDIRVILPLYGNIKQEYRDKFEYLGNFTVHLSWRQEYCGLFRYFKDGVTYYFIDNERYFKRDKLYGYYDDGERYAYFSKAIVEALPHLNFFPDIIHCNDWQSSLVSAYIKTGNWSDFRYYKIKNIYTIHNVEYQGVYGMENLKDLFGIDSRFRNEMEYNGDINLTKSAIQYCDKLTTVSHSYCDNLKQPYCSRGLHHIIIRNEYKLSGIVNGIDYDFYNPATDTALFKNYDYGCMEEKVLNKKLWQDEMGLPVDGDTPMLAIVSRLVSHKGLDLLSKVIEEVLQQDIQLVIVGTGDQRFVDFYKYLESKYPTKVRAFVDSYSNELARKAYAASDIFLMPSKVEPCGISQMIASRYGSVPIVREVGGLKDTIKDFGCEGGGNGYTFTNYNPNDLLYQINRAIRDYENKSEWKEKMKTCMSVDFTWKKPAQEYINLYKSLI